MSQELNQAYDFNQADRAYLHVLNRLVLKAQEQGHTPERTGTGATNMFGVQMRFDLINAFPILTTKAVHWHSIVTELLWFLRGDTNIQYLIQNNVHIWTDWPLKKFNEFRTQLGKREVSAQEFEECIRTDNDFAKSWGDIGKAYGHQWRNFGYTVNEVSQKFTGSTVLVQKGFDQIEWVINEIKTNPTSRRLIVTGWNPHEVDKAALPPCHTLFQFFVENGRLSCQLYQRSADFFLGVPFNIASYALLTHIVAKECGLEVGEFVWTGGVVHLYSNHIEQAKEQLKREPSRAPRLKEFVPVPFDEYNPADFQLENYHPKERIPAPVAV